MYIVARLDALQRSIIIFALAPRNTAALKFVV